MATKLVREKDIEAYLVREVKKRGGLTYKFVSPGRVGVPDRIVILEGRVGFIELKAPGQKLTRLQARTLQELADHACCAWWADSRVDVDAFLDTLASYP